MVHRAAALALFMACIAAPATADVGSEAVVREWIRSVDAHPDWSATAAMIASEGADTVVEGLTFSRPSPDVGITIGRVRLRDLAAREGGGFTVSRIEASSGKLASVSADLTIPAASTGPVSLPGLPGLVFDPKRVLSYTAQLYSALAEAEIADVAVPEITAVQRNSGDEAAGTTVTAVYRDLRIGELRSGVVDMSQVGPITLTTSEAGAPDSRLEIKQVEAERTDFSAVAHVLDEAQYRDGRGDGVWRSALARLRYSGLAGTGPDGTAVRLDEITVENVDARQPPRPFASRLENLSDSAEQTPAETKIALETVSDVLASFRIGAVRMHGLAVEAPAQSGSASLGGITVLGWSGAGVDAFDLRDLRFDSPGGSGALKSMEFAGLVFPDFAAFLDIIGLDEDRPDAALRDAAIRKALYGLPKLGHFALSGLSAGQTAANQVSLQSIALDLKDYVGPFPASAQFTMDGLRIPGELLRLDPQAAQVFDGLGLTELVLGMSVSETWDHLAGKVDASFGLSLKDAGDLDVAYTYAGVTEDWVVSAIAAAGSSPGESDTEAVLKVLDGLRLESGTLTATDRSLLDRGFGFAAAKQNLTLDGPAYREQMRGALPFMLSMAISPDLAKLVTAPLQSFLAGGQRLVIEIRPAAPIPLTALSEAIENDPMSLPGLLNLTLRSEPAAQP